LEEELADTLRDMGHETLLVCGSGRFHESQRPQPHSPIVRLSTGETGGRATQVSILLDYVRFVRALRRYVRDEVRDTDAVLATSSPFFNVFLIGTIRKRAPHARTIFHLHDYLPSNLHSLSIVHRMAAPLVKALTDSALAKWGMVILLAGNIAYHGPNHTVARCWPTVSKIDGRQVDKDAKKALYAGNLGIAHDADPLIETIDSLHNQGWDVDFYGDGPKAALLPQYVDRHQFVSGDEFMDVLYSHPVHLVAGVRRDGSGAFPSKTLNSLYVGAQVVPCGFSPQMLDELEVLKATPDLAQNRMVAAQIVDDYLRAEA
jgi:hypothetical protein